MNTPPPPPLPPPTQAPHPAMPGTPPLASQARGWALQLLRFALRVLIVGSLLAVLITLLFRQAFLPTYIYTLCITASCWGLIEGGLKLAVRLVGEGRPGWPPLRWVVPVVLLGTVLGYSLGNEFGNLLTGLRNSGLLGSAPLHSLPTLVLSLLTGTAFTLFFFTRERIAQAEAQAQAARRVAAENQLRLLESQLEPHMLFNTLANLRVLITLDPPRAQAMLDQLISFLRATLAASRVGQHALGDEFARIADYLALMQVRMGPRLQVQLDLPKALRALPVPPLLLQPLVENSIRHGLEPRVAGGALRVSARREGDALCLSVRDTGVGLVAADSSHVQGGSPATTPNSSHFGLEQVRARLAALHGPSASLTLSSAADAEGGVLAEVRLPWPAAAIQTPA